MTMYPGDTHDLEKLRGCYGDGPENDPYEPPIAKLVGPIEGKQPECPNCGCAQVMEITCQIKDSRLRSGEGIGKYLGCPACPWASPMAIVSKKAMP